MRRQGRMRDGAGVELCLLLAVTLAVATLALPAVDYIQTGLSPRIWQWQPAQRNAWNPYDCCFWQKLPASECPM